jgi:hypothetical protein
MNPLDHIPHCKKLMPHKTIFETDVQEDLKANWGEEWGIIPPFGKIRKVMVYEPGSEQDHPLISQDHQLSSLSEVPTDLDRLREQHRDFPSALKGEGIEVVSLHPKEPLIGTYGIPLRSAPYTGETIMVRGVRLLEGLRPHRRRGWRSSMQNDSWNWGVWSWRPAMGKVRSKPVIWFGSTTPT